MKVDVDSDGGLRFQIFLWNVSGFRIAPRPLSMVSVCKPYVRYVSRVPEHSSAVVMVWVSRPASRPLKRVNKGGRCTQPLLNTSPTPDHTKYFQVRHPSASPIYAHSTHIE